MSVSQTDIIDFAGIDEATGDLRLTISDHLPWDQDEGDHLLILQDNSTRTSASSKAAKCSRRSLTQRDVVSSSIWSGSFH
ncbi:DUF6572 domain-containing protein [Rhizobium laguerreae]|uniref:DUF6572 domain-containing protein n=1 Tax=Rhizobium laguerreae TaxID=1076926 RepID=UPI0028AC4B0D|nr:DUF6572 domain-containing protein [Rhizobium laguerreae]